MNVEVTRYDENYFMDEYDYDSGYKSFDEMKTNLKRRHKGNKCYKFFKDRIEFLDKNVNLLYVYKKG